MATAYSVADMLEACPLVPIVVLVDCFMDLFPSDITQHLLSRMPNLRDLRFQKLFLDDGTDGTQAWNTMSGAELLFYANTLPNLCHN